MLKSTGSGGGTSSTGRLIGFQILTGSGTYTPTIGATSAVVTAIGGGGGSGSARGAATKVAATSGGSSGSWCTKYIGTLGASYAYSAGAAGTAGTGTGSNGGNGGATTFSGTGATLNAPGGLGSAASNDPAVTAIQIEFGTFAPATATGGDINTRGQQTMGVPQGVTTALSYSGGSVGGSTPWGTGGLDGGTQAGSGYGAGAGGVSSTAAVTVNGAAGAPGAVLVWEYS